MREESSSSLLYLRNLCHARSSLDPKDVFIADNGKSLFVWVGKGASDGEKKNAMTYAHVSD